MLSYLAIAAGGALGAVARFATGVALPPDPDGLPWGTLVVNVVGALCLGVMSRRTDLNEPLLLFASVGFLGSFTTFSTFAFELTQRPVGTAALYALTTLALGTAAAWLGTRLDSENTSPTANDSESIRTEQRGEG